MASKKPNRNTLIIGGLVLLTIIVFLLIHFFGGSGPASTGNANADDVINEIMDLESSILEMELVFEQQGLELEQKERLLEEKYDMINSLTQQIEELERQGIVDKETIERLRDQLNSAKGQLLDTYKEEIDVLVIDNSRMTRRIDSITMVLFNNDSLMQIVATENITLAQQVEECQTSGSSTSSTPAAQKQGLFAEDIRIFARPRANAEFEAGGFFEQANMESIKVTFRLVGYGEVPNGLKVLHLVLVNSRGATYQNPSSSGRWVFDGQEKAFSMQIKAEYTGTQQTLSQIFTPSSGEKFVNGANYLEIYYGDKKIGSYRFLVSGAS